MKPDICQSCGLAFTIETRGTNRDQSFNKDYCITCFKDGEFTQPSLTLHQLEIDLLEKAEVHKEISLEEAQRIIDRLHDLKRWRMNNI